MPVLVRLVQGKALREREEGVLSGCWAGGAKGWVGWAGGAGRWEGVGAGGGRGDSRAGGAGRGGGCGQEGNEVSGRIGDGRSESLQLTGGGGL